MGKAVKMILAAAAAFLLLAVLCFAGFMVLADYRNSRYYETATPAGEIEKKYTAPGPCEVSYSDFDASNDAWEKYEVWYPADMGSSGNTYPLVVMANGTGVKASRYKEVFRHLASWGFIVAGNEDESSRTGASSAALLDFILDLNEDGDSVFYGKINRSGIGIAGHSQGGVGAVNAVTAQPNGAAYRAVFTASATSGYWGQEHVFGTDWSYDVSKINIPYFMAAGTGDFDAGTAGSITDEEGQGICPLWSVTENYHRISDSVSKVMARETGMDHGDMLRHADGYMTAWFMYWLKGDTGAGNAFF